MTDRRGQRGQTDGVTVVLMTTLFVVAIGTAGVFYLDSLPEKSSEPVVAGVDVAAVNESDNTTLAVTHTAGESIRGGTLVLPSRNETYELPPRFEEGMTWSTSVSDAPVGSSLHIAVVESETGTVVSNSRVTVRGREATATPAPVYDLTTSTPTSTPTPTPTPAPTATATSTPTPTPDDPPAVTAFDVSSPGKSGKVEVDWTVTDDTELATLDITVRESGTDVAQASPAVSGTSESDLTEFTQLGAGTYEVELVVTDSGGAQTSKTGSVTVDSNGNGNENGSGNGNGNGNGSGNGNGNGNGNGQVV